MSNKELLKVAGVAAGVMIVLAALGADNFVKKLVTGDPNKGLLNK